MTPSPLPPSAPAAPSVRPPAPPAGERPTEAAGPFGHWLDQARAQPAGPAVTIPAARADTARKAAASPAAQANPVSMQDPSSTVEADATPEAVRAPDAQLDATPAATASSSARADALPKLGRSAVARASATPRAGPSSTPRADTAPTVAPTATRSAAAQGEPALDTATRMATGRGADAADPVRPMAASTPDADAEAARGLAEEATDTASRRGGPTVATPDPASDVAPGAAPGVAARPDAGVATGSALSAEDAGAPIPPLDVTPRAHVKAARPADGRRALASSGVSDRPGAAPSDTGPALAGRRGPPAGRVGPNGGDRPQAARLPAPASAEAATIDTGRHGRSTSGAGDSSRHAPVRADATTSAALDRREVAPATAFSVTTTNATTTSPAQPDAGAPGGALGSALAAVTSAGAPPAATAEAAARAQAMAADTLPTPLHSPAFAPALAARVVLMLREGTREARLQLNPAELGPIGIRISVEGAQARVDLAAEQAPTRQVLEQSLPQLASALRDSGLTLSGGGVFDAPRDGRQDGQAGGRDARGGRVATATDAAASDMARAPADAARQVALGMLDLYA